MKKDTVFNSTYWKELLKKLEVKINKLENL